MELESWDQIVPELRKHGIVFSYKWLGVGKSDRAKVVQNGRVIIENLRKLLKIKNLDPPYIVLGHSLGGLYANLWARLYPAELCGVAFIEATHPDHEKKMNIFSPPLFVRVYNGVLDKLDSIFDRNRQFSEIKSFEESAQQLRCSGEFPDIPVHVITGSKKMPFEPDGLIALHLNNQQELAELSIDGKLVIAENSGYFPQVTEPKLVVKEVVRLIKGDRQQL